MGRSRFVTPETARLTLSDGDFIDIKKELNAGESRGVFTRMVKDMRAGERATLDPQKVGVARVMAYLLGWSFVDHEGKPVPVDESAVDSLDAETFKEVSDAIDAHEAVIEKERAERKK